MKWSYKIGKLFGIDIYMHATFLLLLAWAAWSGATGRAGWVGAAIKVSAVLMTFAIVVLHELGHSLAARKIGIPTKDIVLLPIGGMARVERMPEKPAQELFVALAGPAVNLVLGGICAAIYYWQWGWIFDELYFTSLGNFIANQIFFYLMCINGGLLAFNLIPAFPMDGGRVLRACLGFKYSFLKATEMAVTVGRIFGFAFLILGFKYGFTLSLIGIFNMFSGRNELLQVKYREYMKTASLGYDPRNTSPTQSFVYTAPNGQTFLRRLILVHGPLGMRTVVQDVPMAGNMGYMSGQDGEAPIEIIRPQVQRPAKDKIPQENIIDAEEV